MSERTTTGKSSICQNVVFYFALSLLTFVFLAVFSYYTSPFTTCDNGADAAFFRLVGQGMTQGYLPYRDFYDMKGPFLFFIEYIGQLISYGRVGIFLLQWINLLCTVIMICKLFNLYHITNRKMQCCLLLPLAYIASITFQGGNLTEEFSLIELVSCLYICLDYFKNSDNPSVFWQRRIYWYAGAWYGFCFGLLLMIRITNAALICAMGIIVFLDLVKARKLRQLGVCSGMFFVGLLFSVLPAVIFYGMKGLLGDMLEAVFVLGYRYSGRKKLLQHIAETITLQNIPLLLLLLVPCLVPFLLRWRSWRERFLVLIGALLTFLAIASGNNYLHYYTLTIPLVIVLEISVAEAFLASRNRKCVAAIVLSGIMLLSLLPSMGGRLYHAYTHLFQQDQYRTEALVRDISSRIPEEDKTSVFCYNLIPSWYTYADLFPCIKYCGWQNRYLSLMPETYVDFSSRFRSQPPAWLVLPKEKGTLPAFLSEALGSDYIEYYKNGSYTLYHYQPGK